jgi:hypothetical protein
MTSFEVSVWRFEDAELTLDEVLKTVAFQNSAGNVLVNYSITGDPIVLTFRTP